MKYLFTLLVHWFTSYPPPPSPHKLSGTRSRGQLVVASALTVFLIFATRNPNKAPRHVYDAMPHTRVCVCVSVCVCIVFTAYFYVPVGIFIEQKSEEKKPHLAIHLSVFPEPPIPSRVCVCVSCACLSRCVCVCAVVRAAKRQQPKADTDT